MSAAAGSHHDDMLETQAVHFAVQIVSLLGHFAEAARVQSIYMLYQLAQIMDKRVNDIKKKIDKIVLGFQGDDKGLHTSVHELLHFIGPALANMAVAIVAGLECFYSHQDWNFRGICTSALSRIVFENEKQFVEEDQHIHSNPHNLFPVNVDSLTPLILPLPLLAAIWNLYFSLTFIPLTCKIFPDRVVVALGLLAPQYVGGDPTLSLRVVESLMRLPDKTPSEIEAVKSTLRKIFDKLEKIGILASTVKNEDASMKTLFSVFQSILTPYDESAYDLLPWALENYTNSAVPVAGGSADRSTPQQRSAGFNLQIKECQPLVDFLRSLSNHFRATPPLVRYGACMCLHTSLAILPTIIVDNKSFATFIISGVLDTDYLSAFLYTSMLEYLDVGTPTPKIKDMVAKYRHEVETEITYDSLFLNQSTTVTLEQDEVRLSNILDVAITRCLPISEKVMHKLASSLEFLNRSGKLRQLELIRVWCKRLDKLDTFLMQLLMPSLNDEDEDIQMATIKILHSLVPAFNSANVDIGFAWGYLGPLLDVRTETILLRSVLILIRSIPLFRISEDARDQFLNSLFLLIFHRDPDVRYLVYQLLGDSTEFWRQSSLLNPALGIMILSLGDQNFKCNKLNIDLTIRMMGSTPFSPYLITHLSTLREIIHSPISNDTLKCFSELASAIAKDRAGELRELVVAITLDENVDTFWQYFLGSVDENQLAKPDDYNYSKNFVHSPCWTAILLTKLGIHPPPLVSLSNPSTRDVMPTSPAGRRRFMGGFLMTLLPTCGITDPVLREAACLSCILCCIRGTLAHPGIMRCLLEFVSQQMMTHKQWTYQLSALDILKLLVRLKLPGVSPAILLQYIDMVLDVSFNSPTINVKKVALELLEVLLLVFPNGVTQGLIEARDVVRSLIVDEEPQISTLACRIYSTIFRSVTSNNVEDFLNYLKSELRVLPKLDSPEAAADPLLANLPQDSKERILECSLLAMGAIQHKPTANAIIQEILPYLSNNAPNVRLAAFGAILQQFPILESADLNSTMWILLPLFTDPCKRVRLAFHRFLTGEPITLVDVLTKNISQHADDAVVMSSVSWEDYLIDATSITVNSKNFSDMFISVDSIIRSSEDLGELSFDDDGLYLPTVSKGLMERLKQLAKKLTGITPEQHSSKILYFLQEYQHCPHLQAGAILVLSEFSCVHENSSKEIIDILANHLGREITSDSKAIIEAAMLGLRSISGKEDLFIWREKEANQIFIRYSEFSPAAFKLIINRISAPQIPSEGELLALLYLTDGLKEVYANKAGELLKKYLPMMTSQRHASIKRLYVVLLTVDLASVSGLDDMGLVCDGIQTFLDQVQDEEDIKLKIYGCLGKIVSQVGPKHQLFRNLLNNAKRDLKSKDHKLRMSSLAIFRIFLKFVSADEAMWFCFMYLADSTALVQRLVQREYSLFEPFFRSLFTFFILQANLLGTGQLPSMRRLGISLNTKDDAEDQSALQPLNDNFNVQYWSSDRRRKFTSIYGLPEENFARAMIPLAQPMMDLVEERSLAFRRPSLELLRKYEWLLAIDSISILHECMKKYPGVAIDLIERLIADVESSMPTIRMFNHILNVANQGLRDDTMVVTPELSVPNGPDVEVQVHNLNVLSNLLFALDGLSDRVPTFLERLQTIISDCVSQAEDLRESLYADVENSFFFFNEYMDIPIVSDEQLSFDCIQGIFAGGDGDLLRRLMIIALHGTNGYGVYHALSTSCTEGRMVFGFQFLTDLVDCENRGIREAAVDALSTIASIQLEQGSMAVLLNKIQAIITTIWKRLENEKDTLYRRKAEMSSLISNLVCYVSDRDMRMGILKLLIDFWRDPDSEVRATAIKMVQRLGEAGLPEVRECFDAVITDDGDDSRPSPPRIMQALAELIGHPDFTEKEELSALLKWRFDQGIAPSAA
ncbi:armadillo-type protein [Cladochytrium replicatum]|nr:armadillo-type protein [Cladochytrium replicatum]